MPPNERSVCLIEQSNPHLPAFASNLEYLVSEADLWIHGHIHAASDYLLENCEVVCNQRGYPGLNRRHPELSYENAHPKQQRLFTSSDANRPLRLRLQRPSAAFESRSREGLLEIIALVKALVLEQRWTDRYEFLFRRRPLH